MLINIFVYFLFFIVALMYFTPKSSIYFFLETQLKEYEAVISREEVVDSGFILDIKHANVSLKSISSANISRTTLKIFILYNSIDLQEVILSSTAKSFVPLHLDSVHIVHSILNPLNVIVHSVGEFGEIEAKFNIVDRTFHLNLKPSKIMLKDYKNTLKNLSKTENGEFTYDKTF